MPEQPTNSLQPGDGLDLPAASGPTGSVGPGAVDRLTSTEPTREVSAASTGPPPPARGDDPPMAGAPRGYEILGELGRGGMGAVYRARQLALNRVVALKVILAGGHAGAPERIRFLHEAEAVAALDHPNVVRVHELGQHDGLPYIVLEYLSGGTLAAYARGPLPAREAAGLVEQIARGVAHAHAHQVIHRDLKPENVLLAPGEPGRAPTPKVADFGLAKRLDVGTGVTATGAVMGTPGYMAPEQAGDTKHVGPAADIWAVGAILYRLLTGRPPFQGSTALETIRKVVESEPERPSRVAPDTPRPLEVVCLKCLQKNPADRYPTATAVADDLRRWLNGEAVVTRLPRTRVPRRALVGAGFAAVVGIGVWGALPHLLRKSEPPTSADTPETAPGEPLNAVAVLPFVNVGGNPDDEYLSDGISESVANSLLTVRELKVRPFASVLAFKGQVDLKAAGRKLGVPALVTGRLTRNRDRLSVSVELIDLGTDTKLWGERFDRPVTEVHALQVDVARQLTHHLKLKFGQTDGPASRHVPDSEAVLFYLKGRRAFNLSTSQKQTLLAIEDYRKAINKDKEYALPHVALAEAYYWLSNNYEPPDKVIPTAKAAAARAVELDDSLGEAHAMLGLFATIYDWDWTRAEREFGRAKELSPGSATVYMNSALYQLAVGQPEDALVSVRLAQERDPNSSYISNYAGFLHYLTGRTDKAVELIRSQIKVDPDNFLPHAYLGLCLEELGRFDEAIKEFDTTIRLDSTTEAVAQRGHVLAVARRPIDARTVLNALIAERERYRSPTGSAGPVAVLGGLAEAVPAPRYVSAYNVAVLYAGLGETDRTFEWMEAACAEHSEWLAMLQTDPRIRPLRADPRYRDLLRRLRLAP
jgi:serine/threonine-protein kinase